MSTKGFRREFFSENMGATHVALQWLHPLSIQVMVSITAGRLLGPGTLEKGWVRPKQAWVGI